MESSDAARERLTQFNCVGTTRRPSAASYKASRDWRKLERNRAVPVFYPHKELGAANGDGMSRGAELSEN